MGLAAPKQKQRIGDDPRNTKWAKNQSNPGFKILASMGWSPATKSLGAPDNPLEPVRSTWKRLPGSVLPIIKSTTSGLGSNPNQSSSNSYLLSAPTFVRSSQSIVSAETRVDIAHPAENDQDRSTNISIVANVGSQSGGFNDLLQRLNRLNQTSASQSNKLQSTEENELASDSFVLVSVDKSGDVITEEPKPHRMRSIIMNKKNRPRKRVRILELGHDCNHKLTLLDEPKLKKLKKNPGTIIDPNHQQQEIDKNLNIESGKNPLRPNQKSNENLQESDLLVSNLTPMNTIKQPLNQNFNQQIRTSSISRPLKISRPINPRVASRVKYIKSKRMPLANPTAMDEILGIAPS